MAKDPRIAIAVDVMRRSRSERAKRMILVNDMRKKDGRFTMEQEAEAIIKALDNHAAQQTES